MTQWRKLACALLCAMIVLAPSLADARAGASSRSGGGSSYSSQGSRGARTYDNNGAQSMQRSITPQPAPSTQAPLGTPGARPGFAQNHPFLTGLAGGFVGSWIGSMLFPHFGMGMGMGYGGGFGGVLGSVFSWLLIIGLIYLGFRMFRRWTTGPATVPNIGPMAYDSPQPATPRYGGGGGGGSRGTGSLPISDADFQAFEGILKNVQGAWSKGDLATLRHYVTPEMLSYFSEQLAEAESQGVSNHVDNVELVNGDVRESWDEGRLQYATAALRWRANDYTVRNDRKPGEPGWLVEGDPQRPSEASEMWTFARSPGGHWLLSAIQQV